MIFLALVGCGSDPLGESPPGLSGDWVLQTTVVQKSYCAGDVPSETLIEAFTISVDGSTATLEFDGYVLEGAADPDGLSATGTLPDGQSVQIELHREGSALRGSLTAAGRGCTELRDAVATRYTADADFSGHWGFQLTVVGESGCSHIEDYDDCFRIIQTGRDLLVVDDEDGNLTGYVVGDLGKIVRETASETTTLIFHIAEAGDRLTGPAVRQFHAQACRTDLEFVGVLRTNPCANPKH